jgi:hypothetical protein
MMMDSAWHKVESAGDTDMLGNERQEGARGGVLCPLIPHDQCTAHCRSFLDEGIYFIE